MFVQKLTVVVTGRWPFSLTNTTPLLYMQELYLNDCDPRLEINQKSLFVLHLSPSLQWGEFQDGGSRVEC